MSCIGKIASRATDASKMALAHLVARLRKGGYTLLDTQFVTEHLATLGAVAVSRRKYHRMLDKAIGALDRIAPGLGGIARQNAAPMLAMGLAFIGQPTELEGQRAYAIPLRFQDGMVFLGPLQVGQTPPLY